MKIRVLGSAAGGGFPQWNCNCRNCSGLRNGSVRTRARTQSSLAVTGTDEDAWVLVNASPDVLRQLQENPVLQPARAPRDTALAGIVLIDGQVDHTTGLLLLREATRPWPLWCTDEVYDDLTHGNPVLDVLCHFCGIDRHRIGLQQEFEAEGVPGVLWRALPVASQPAPYSPRRGAPAAGDNIALVMRDQASGRSAVYAPGLSAMDPMLWEALQEASCVLLDGTFWSDHEMIDLGFSSKTAREIGHLPQSGPGGLLELLKQLPADTRRILIHINNTNPILDEDSPERATLAQQGVEVAWDGMEIIL